MKENELSPDNPEASEIAKLGIVFAWPSKRGKGHQMSTGTFPNAHYGGSWLAHLDAGQGVNTWPALAATVGFGEVVAWNSLEQMEVWVTVSPKNAKSRWNWLHSVTFQPLREHINLWTNRGSSWCGGGCSGSKPGTTKEPSVSLRDTARLRGPYFVLLPEGPVGHGPRLEVSSVGTSSKAVFSKVN